MKDIFLGVLGIFVVLLCWRTMILTFELKKLEGLVKLLMDELGVKFVPFERE